MEEKIFSTLSKDKLVLGNEWFRLTDKDLIFIKQYEV